MEVFFNSPLGLKENALFLEDLAAQLFQFCNVVLKVEKNVFIPGVILEQFLKQGNKILLYTANIRL